jgi:hypothetical protein
MYSQCGYTVSLYTDLCTESKCLLTTKVLHVFNDARNIEQICWVVKIKVKSLYLTNYHVMETYWGSGGIAPHIPDLGARWMSAVSFMPRSLFPWQHTPRYPLGRKLDGSQSRSGRGGEGKKSLRCLFRGSNPSYLACSLVTILTELPRLHC